MKNANKLSFALIAGLMLFTVQTTFGQDINVLPNNELAPPPPQMLGESEHEVQAAISIGFYPNPCTEILTIELANQQPFKEDVVDIYSLTGSKIWNGTINQKKSIDVSHLNPGIYVLSCKGVSYKFQKV